MTEQNQAKLIEFLKEFESKIKELDKELGRFLGYTKVINKVFVNIEREDSTRYLLKINIICSLGDVDELWLSKLEGAKDIVKRILNTDNAAMVIRFSVEPDYEEDGEFCDCIKAVDIILDIREIILIPK